MLLLSSFCFYTYHNPEHLSLLVGISAVAFFGGQLVGRLQGFRASLAAGLCIFLLLLPLVVFKYSQFLLISVLNYSPAALPAGVLEIGLTLPLGISFFTFQNIGYVADRLRGGWFQSVSAQKYALYISFFPQLVAGPIVTAREFLPQLENRSFFYNKDYALGFTYLCLGYLKKAYFADSLAGVVDPVFANSEVAGGLAVLLAVFGYSMQIYFDFSGYSDIAIGIGLWFGFRLPENFSHPYAAGSFRDFWRRWHITLSRWLRDHLYIPLGGSRAGASRMYFALLVTMLLGGLWHGAHWNFILWGAGHGLVLIFERWIPAQWWRQAVFSGLYRILVLVLIVLLWIPFRAGSEPEGLATTLDILFRLFSWAPGEFSEANLRLVGGILLLLVIGSLWGERLFVRWNSIGFIWRGGLLALSAILLLLLAPGGSGFIYFVF